MAPKSSKTKLNKLKVLLAYVIYCCLSGIDNQHSDSASSFAQALIYHKYEPATQAPLLSRVQRQPANITASDSYYHNYQTQSFNRQQQQQQQQQQKQQPQQQQQQISYLTSSEPIDELGQDYYVCPLECHCNTIAHIADCSDRNLTRVPARFPKDIKRIRLERNNITEIGPYAFQGLKRLQRIDLSNNNLHKIDTLAFSGGLQALNTLILFNNKLEHLPVNVFSELANLQILLLNANSLQTIHKDLFQSLTNLYLLSLYDNNIVSLASGTFDALRSVKTIHLGKNPLNCDCNLRWLVDYFEANPTVETSEARCELPTRSQGKRLSQLNKTELKCQEPIATNVNNGANIKGPNGDQSAGSSCPAGCVCTGSTVDCSRAGANGPASPFVESAAGPSPSGGLYELPDVPDDLPVYVARVHINDNRIKRIRQTGLFKKLVNSQKLDLGNNKIVDVEDNAINGHLSNGQKPERVIFVLLENQHCDNKNNNNNNNRQASEPSPNQGSLTSARRQQQENPDDVVQSACSIAPKVNEPQFDSPCYNGGACKPVPAPSSTVSTNFTCQCPAGFGGPLCEINTDDCIDHQCQNGAMCVDGINSYKCICRDPTTSGEFCEQLSSSNNNNNQFNLAAASQYATGGLSSNLIAPLALPIIAQSGSGAPIGGSQSNDLVAASTDQHQSIRSHQPQILARSANFLRQPDDLVSNSLQQSNTGTNKTPWKACHRITTSRYYDDGNGCQSVRLLKINECAGSCEARSGAGCCVPTKIKRRRIHMQCGDGASYVKVVDLVKKCSCSQEHGSCPANNNMNNEALARTLLPDGQVSSTPANSMRSPTLAPTTNNIRSKSQAQTDQQQFFKYSASTSGGREQRPGGHGESYGAGNGSQEDQLLQIARLDAVEQR